MVLVSTTLTLSDGKMILCRFEDVPGGKAIFKRFESIFPRFVVAEMTVLRGRMGIPPLLVILTTCLSLWVCKIIMEMD